MACVTVGLLVWHGRSSRRLPRTRDPRAWGWMAGAFVLTGVGWTWSLRAASALAWLAVARGAIGLIAGRPFARLSTGPLILLATVIPLPYLPELAALLQLAGAWAVARVLPLMGIPVIAEGIQLHLPATTLVVGEDCSGLHSLMSLISTLTGFICLMPSRPITTRWLAALLLPLVLLGNWTRIASTVIITHLGGEEIGLAYWHDVSGWLTFLLELLMLAAIWRWRERVPALPSSSPA